MHKACYIKHIVLCKYFSVQKANIAVDNKKYKGDKIPHIY